MSHFFWMIVAETNGCLSTSSVLQGNVLNIIYLSYYVFVKDGMITVRNLQKSLRNS